MPGRSIVRALVHRNFRLFFAGQTLSLIGTWTQSFAMPWLVSGLTNSQRVQGLVAFSSQLPNFFLPPFAGVITDRMNRWNLLFATQVLAMIQAFGLAALVWSGHVEIWQLVLFNFGLSAINAFDTTARQTFIGEMLDNRDDLANAIALNSAMANGTRLFGPMLAALLINLAGESGCFLVNAISFLAVLIALLGMRLPPRAAVGHHSPMWRGMREGFNYAVSHSVVRMLLLLVSVVSLMALPYAVLMPIYARETLGNNPHGYGMLMTAPGVGMLSASLIVAWLGLRHALMRIAVGPIITGCCMIGFAATRILSVELMFLFGVGFGILLLLNTSNMLLQSLVPDHMRGRVLSFYMMAFLGMAPIGSLVLGSAADSIGVTRVLIISGACCLTAGIAVAAINRKALLLQDLKPPTIAEPNLAAQKVSELNKNDNSATGALVVQTLNRSIGGGQA